MRLLIQRVQEARVFIQKQLHSEIGLGLLVFLGIHKEDQASQIPWFVNKLVHLRIFNDDEGKMNRSIKEKEGQILVVSQFTLYGNCLSGRRPDFLQAALPALALPLYQQFIEQLSQEIGIVQTGVFGAEMQISLINDGPVTFLLEPQPKSNNL
jgi:D-tyrosyl-tRNA(Tyr) deacylase